MMKTLSALIFALLATTIGCYSQSESKKTGPAITWEKQTHDFGDITQGDKVEYTYRFTNSGEEPLVITNVQVTCGCTVPKGWPRDPVAPGDKGEITVAFNSSGKFGRQNKVVTIVSNSILGNSQVTFTTNVLDKKNPN